MPWDEVGKRKPRDERGVQCLKNRGWSSQPPCCPSGSAASLNSLRQVSWLAGLSSKAAFPGRTQWHLAFRSPLTVAGAAAGSGFPSPHSLFIPVLGNRRVVA